MKVKFHQCRNVNHPFPLVSWLIMMFQGMKPWDKKSHSHMAISCGDLFLDMTGKNGCRLLPSKKFKETYIPVGTHELKEGITKEEFMAFFIENKNKEYDHWQITGLLLKMLGLITFNKWGDDLKKLVCNELLIAYLVKFHDLKFKDSDNFDLITTWNKAKEY